MAAKLSNSLDTNSTHNQAKMQQRKSYRCCIQNLDYFSKIYCHYLLKNTKVAKCLMFIFFMYNSGFAELSQVSDPTRKFAETNLLSSSFVEDSKHQKWVNLKFVDKVIGNSAAKNRFTYVLIPELTSTYLEKFWSDQ